MEETGKKSRQKAATDAYRRVPNMNLFPAELRRKLITSLGRTSLYVLLVAVVATVLLVMRQERLQADVVSLTLELQSLRSQTAAAEQERGQVEKLLSEIGLLEQSQRDYAALSGFGGWAGFLTEVQAATTTTGVALASIRQTKDGAVLSGTAPGPTEAVAFRKAAGQAANVASAELISLSKGTTESRFSFTVQVQFSEVTTP